MLLRVVGPLPFERTGGGSLCILAHDGPVPLHGDPHWGLGGGLPWAGGGRR